MGDLNTVGVELEQAMLEMGIPPCPRILLDLAAQARSAEPDLQKIEKLICADVGLSAALIKTVNSPFYGLRSKVHSIMQAIHMLGLSHLSLMVTSMVLRDVLKGMDQVAMNRFWDASSRIAIISSYIAGRLPYIAFEHMRREIDKDEAYTFALFQDCGIPIMLQRHPAYKQTLALANQEKDRKFTALEDDAHAQNHARVGHMLATSWGLPDFMCLAIRLHHDYDALSLSGRALPTASKDLIGVALLAEKAIQIIMNLDHTCEWEKGGQWVMQHFGINEVDFASIINGIRILHEEGNLSG